MKRRDPAEAGRSNGGSEPATPIVPSVRRIDGHPSRRSGPLTVRTARPDDVPACTEVWASAMSELQLRLNQPAVTGDLAPLGRLLAHVRETDPERFLVATRTAVAPDWAPAEAAGRRLAEAADGPDAPERIVGFVSATIRGDVWFLAMLFVHPEEQAAGLGRTLLRQVLADPAGPEGIGSMPGPGDPAASARPSVMATVTDSIQPISNALYARVGIVPRLPLFHLVGRPARPAALPPLPAGITAIAFETIAAGPPDGPGHRELSAAVGRIDRVLLGYEHPRDHRFLRRDGRVGYLYRGPDGVPLGYGYTSPVGRVGPVAVLDETLLAPVVGHLLAVLPPRGASSLWIPGAAGPTFRALLAAGLRIEDFPALLCWSRPFGSFERYLPASLAVL